MSGSIARPAMPARIAAWCLAFILTLTLTISALLGPASFNRVLTDEDLHIRTATDDSVIQEQMEKVSSAIRIMAEEEHFRADRVIRALKQDDFKKLNEQAAEWWKNIMSEGRLTEIPAWNADDQMISIIIESMDPNQIPNDELEETAKGIANEIEQEVNQTVMPFRKALVSLGVRYISRKMDPGSIIRFVSKIPEIAAAASLLLTGLIAFLTGKRIRWSLKYYGASFAGAGLSTLTALMMIRNADLSGLLNAASKGLNHQIQTMIRTVAAETWACAVILFALGMVFLICYNHEPRKKKTTEKPS